VSVGKVLSLHWIASNASVRLARYGSPPAVVAANLLAP